MTAPALAKQTPHGRMYEHPKTGEQVPSVTTILNALAKPALVGWAAKEAANYAVENWEPLSALEPGARLDVIKGAHKRTSGDAAKLGDAVHQIVDAWSSGTKVNGNHDEKTYPHLTQFSEFLDVCEPTFLYTEVTVWSRTYQYAGTADWVARIGSFVVLGDHKTGKSVWPEAALQMEALSKADFIIGEDGEEVPLPAIDRLAVLHLRPRSWALVPVKEEHRTEHWHSFLACRQLHDWERNTSWRSFDLRQNAATWVGLS